VFCIHCGRQTQPGAQFCAHCGSAIVSAQSAADASDDNESLEHAGRPVSQVAEVGNSEASTQMPGKRSHPVSGVLSFLLVLAVAAAAYLGFSHKADEFKIHAELGTFAQAFNEQDIHKMVSCLDQSSQGLVDIVSNIGSGNAFTKVFEILAPVWKDALRGALPDFEISVGDIEFPTPDTAKVDTDFILGNDGLHVTILMVRDGDTPLKNFFENTWRIKLL